jgi:hypothetical protein
LIVFAGTRGCAARGYAELWCVPTVVPVVVYIF